MRVSSTLRTGGLLTVAALCAACSNAPTRTPTPPHRDARVVDLDALVPADVDLVVRADLARARAQSVFDDVLAWLRGAELSEVMIETTTPCLELATVATLALRLGPNGFDGDAILRLKLPPDALGAVPCNAKGWKPMGDSGSAAVFEPAEPERRRGAPAMMLRDRSGNVLVATPGQIDSVLRLVRDGPDPEPLIAPSDSMVGLVARVDEAQLPRAWREKTPTLTALASGLSQLTIRLDVGERIDVHATFLYADRQDAEQASRTLRTVRDALLKSERESFKRAAQAAHAEKVGEQVRVELTLPRGL